MIFWARIRLRGILFRDDWRTGLLAASLMRSALNIYCRLTDQAREKTVASEKLQSDVIVQLNLDEENIVKETSSDLKRALKSAKINDSQ